MGVPKFFRWISERYPAISQLIAENRIPEFDCLYLDMNGIIHNCTHRDTDVTSFRMTEEQMYITIFNYIEHLYGKIKPKQLFFMAVDGVAPRAKMNQQRARRFRTALDAELAIEKAVKEGKEIPKEEVFDSNAITPGSEFMHKLTRQLKYFISKKVSDDANWKDVKIILSGHEVPGEGEHKIMEYIRLAKAQPDYDPNVRHCLYGLDADLIMLGLLSHDPHFCLLREEVTFGRSGNTKSKELEHQKFYLMHLCIVREYLELEFQELKKPGALQFDFNLEHVIDDFILMAFFVGNDFLPNLPNLLINEGALALMFKIYKKILPKTNGYINEGGIINMERLAILLGELSHVEYRFFESDVADQSWFDSKKMSKKDVMLKEKTSDQLTMTSRQKKIWQDIKIFLTNQSMHLIDLPQDLAASDRRFFETLANRLDLVWRSVQDEVGNRHMQLYRPLASENNNTEVEKPQPDNTDFIKLYDDAKMVDISVAQNSEEMDLLYDKKFQEWKDAYYQSKFEWDRNNDHELLKLCENYVQGLQWILFYYYRGVVSWAWYYQYHYAPMISDIVKGLNADMNFELGKPFRPFEQLMGVLPDRSKSIVPPVYRDLMTSSKSPIVDFYPRDFELDMNGKRNEWESVVKIPFIDEKRLLAAMATRNHLLSEEEKKRNEFGVTLQFCYDMNINYVFPSSLIGIFPDIPYCHCVEKEFYLPVIEGLKYNVGLVEGVKLGDAALAGFPSLSTLPYRAALDFHGVSVFQSESRNESMIISLEDLESRADVKMAIMKLGQKVYVGYPYLQEGKVVKVCDEHFDYLPSNDGIEKPIQRVHSLREIEDFNKKADRIEYNYSNYFGIVIGPVKSIIHVEMMKGLRKTDEGATVKEYGVIPGMETEFATQVVVDEVTNEDQRFLEQAALPLEEEFPPGTRAFFLGEFDYGRPLEIIGHDKNRTEIWLSGSTANEQEFGHQVIQDYGSIATYTPAFAVAQMLGLNSLTLSKITSSFLIETASSSRINLGLNLKFESKKQKVLGYSQKSDKGWEYSNKAIELLVAYISKFPEFFAGLQRSIHASEWKSTDFYPAETADQKIKEIVEWLKSIQSQNFERVPLDSEQLEPEIVAAIEKAADKMLETYPGVVYKKLKGVPRYALLKPSDAEHRLGNQSFSLGDRVVYVQDSGRVPIATRGVVVGISRTKRTVLLDVVFDLTFMSGTTLGSQCTPFRGSTVPTSSVINLTNKQVIAETKPSNWRYSDNNMGIRNRYNSIYPVRGGGGNYRDAVASPPRRSTYRGAMLGNNQNSIFQSSSSIQEQGRDQRPNYENSWNTSTRGNLPIRGSSPRQRYQPRGGRNQMSTGNDVGRTSSNSMTSYNAVPPPMIDSSRGARGGSWGRDKGGPRFSRGRGNHHPAPNH
ncbi:5'-3' exoribonuclease 1 [Erysiphe neolycopersici]|uniref:5'-3' exoribonuclease 1 n=1 Tax=Erysiphe neolycopersici TaxID=212602 RepID=A0A420HVX0_9PEZI|nr:5'-3' exoribonuclease 1 [Erysiphe neolycopersici]